MAREENIPEAARLQVLSPFKALPHSQGDRNETPALGFKPVFLNFRPLSKALY